MPRFLADEMLGSLARWLRIMGCDTEYARGITDREVLDLALEQGRVVLTRDRQLAERAGGGGLYVVSDFLDDQVSQVAEAFGLRFDGAMTRCTLCNGQLSSVGRDDVEGRVPPQVLASRDEFHVCSRCGQVYWKGSHWDAMTDRLERVLGPRSDSSPR